MTCNLLSELFPQTWQASENYDHLEGEGLCCHHIFLDGDGDFNSRLRREQNGTLTLLLLNHPWNDLSSKLKLDVVWAVFSLLIDWLIDAKPSVHVKVEGLCCHRSFLSCEGEGEGIFILA